MLQKLKKPTIVFLSLLLLLIIGGVLTINSLPFQKIDNNITVQSRYAKTVDYAEWAAVYVDAGTNDKIEWSFSGSNSFVGITVMAMTDSEYDEFSSGYDYTYASLSDGGYYSDSGTFFPPTYDTWYIVFLNEDTDMESTYLTYEATRKLEYKIPAFEFIPVLLAMFLILYLSVIQIKRKKIF